MRNTEKHGARLIEIEGELKEMGLRQLANFMRKIRTEIRFGKVTLIIHDGQVRQLILIESTDNLEDGGI